MKYTITFLLCLFISEFYGQHYKFEKVTVQELSKTQDDDFPEAPAAILHKDIMFEYGKVLYVSERIKIYNKEGFEYSNWETQFDDIESLRAYIYNLENGQVVQTKVGKENIFKEKVDNDTEITKIAFPNVKEGSILELRYKVQYIGMRYINTQAFIPIKRLKISIRNPNNFRLKVTENPLSKVFLTRNEKNSEFVFLGQNIEPLKREKYVSNINNYRGRIFIEKVWLSNDRWLNTWEDVAESYNDYDWFGGELKKDGGIYKKDLKNLIGTETDPLEISKRIFHFVQNRMTWDNYYSRGCNNMRKIYIDKEGDTGDINLLLTSMLRKAGLKANPALITSKNRGYILFPTIMGFNNLIATVEIDNKIYLLDASQKKAPFGLLPENLINGNGLIVYKDDTYKLVLTNEMPASKNTTLIKASINADELSVNGSIATRINNHFAWNFRNRYDDSEGKSYSNTLEKTYKLLTVSDLEKKNFEDLEKPISYSYNFEFDDSIEEINGDLYFEPLLYFGVTENIFKEEDRKFTIDYEYPFSKSYIFNYQIPEGYVVRNLPKAKKIVIENNIGFLKYNVHATNNMIQVSFIIQINHALIPASYYEGLKALYAEYFRISKSKIVLSKSI